MSVCTCVCVCVWNRLCNVSVYRVDPDDVCVCVE